MVAMHRSPPYPESNAEPETGGIDAGQGVIYKRSRYALIAHADPSSLKLSTRQALQDTSLLYCEHEHAPYTFSLVP